MNAIIIAIVFLFQTNPTSLERPYLEIEIYSKNKDVLQVLYKDSTDVVGVHGGYHGFIFAGLEANSSKTIKIPFDTINILVGVRFAFAILRSNEIKIYNIKINDGRQILDYSASSLIGDLIYNQNITRIQISSDFITLEADKEGGIFLNNLLQKSNKSHFLELKCNYDKSDLMLLRYTCEDGTSEVTYRHIAAGDDQLLKWEMPKNSRIANFTIDILEQGKAKKLEVTFLRYYYFGREMIWDSSNWDLLDCTDCLTVLTQNHILIEADSSNNFHNPIIYTKNRIYLGNEAVLRIVYSVLAFISLTIVLFPFNKKMLKIYDSMELT